MNKPPRIGIVKDALSAKTATATLSLSVSLDMKATRSLSVGERGKGPHSIETNKSAVQRSLEGGARHGQLHSCMWLARGFHWQLLASGNRTPKPSTNVNNVTVSA